MAPKFMSKYKDETFQKMYAEVLDLGKKKEFSQGQIEIMYYSVYNFLKELNVENPEQRALGAIKDALSFNESFDNVIILAKCITIHGKNKVNDIYKKKGMNGIKLLYTEIREYYKNMRWRKVNTEQKTIDEITDFYMSHPENGEFQYFLSQKGLDISQFRSMDKKTKKEIAEEFGKKMFREVLYKYSLQDIIENFPEKAPSLFVSIITSDDPEKVVNSFREENTGYALLREWYTEFNAQEEGLTFEAFKHGMIAYLNAKKKGVLKRYDVYTIVDFTKPSGEPRLYVLDMKNKKIIMKCYVTHGKGKGKTTNPFEYVKYVGDKVNSYLSPYGLMKTANKEFKEGKGYILRLIGLEEVNKNVLRRGVYIHKAPYASEEFLKSHGHLGRSEGCFVVDSRVLNTLIDHIKGGSGFFVYYPVREYFAKSDYMKEDILKNPQDLDLELFKTYSFERK